MAMKFFMNQSKPSIMNLAQNEMKFLLDVDHVKDFMVLRFVFYWMNTSFSIGHESSFKAKHGKFELNRVGVVNWM